MPSGNTSEDGREEKQKTLSDDSQGEEQEKAGEVVETPKSDQGKLA